MIRTFMDQSMTPKTGFWKYIKAATEAEKQEMTSQIEAENEFQLQEPHGWDENDNDCPIHFKLENHRGYQMQAYTPSGNMMDGFHEIFIKCLNCKTIFTYAGDDDEQICPNCYSILISK